MKTIKLYYLPDGTKLEKAIQNCKGDVFLELPDKTRCNLKQDHGLTAFISSIKPQHVNMNLEYTESDDIPILIAALA
ncbi:MAG: hypothetical protein J5653_06645 [Clostridiales bacterium]|nr:hypothetical protein [Clostridiales bacterium]